MKKLNYTKKKLADGLEDDILKQKFEIQVSGKKIELSLKEFYNNSFNELKDLKNEVAKNESFQISDFDGSYESSERLSILYTIKEGLLILLSYGEFQPGRYQLYVEGVYNMEQVQNLKLKL